MELLISLLPNDYQIKIDFLQNIDGVYTRYYVDNMNDLITFNPTSIKVRNIIEKFVPSITNKIDSLYINNNILVDDENHEVAPSALLFESSEDEVNSNEDDMIKIVQAFYTNQLNRDDITVNISNIKSLLENNTDISGNKLAKVYSLTCYNNMIAINTHMVNNIYEKFNNKISYLYSNDIKEIQNGWKYVKYRLFIFLKVIGKDLLNLIKIQMHDSDPFSLMFAKFNRLQIETSRFILFEYYTSPKNKILINNISEYECVFLLFLLCKNNDGKGSLIDVFNTVYSNKVKLYQKRSIRYNTLYCYR